MKSLRYLTKSLCNKKYVLENRCMLSSFSNTMYIFNNNIKKIQRQRALSDPDSYIYDYIKKEIAYRVADRVFDIKRHFSVMVELGTYKGFIAEYMNKETVGKLICISSLQESLNKIKPVEDLILEKLLIENDENFEMTENSVDIVISSLNFHWINNLPALYKSIFNCLKSDGVFIGSMFGGQTLFELRSSLQLAEMEREGGFGLHISPFITPQDIGGLLTKAGFTMLTIDADEIVIHYPTMFELMNDLQGMSENNALIQGQTHLNRDSLLAAAAIYDQLYGIFNEKQQQRAVPGTFQVFYFIAWKPDPSQPKPLSPQKPEFSLKDIAHLDKLKPTNKKK